MDPGRRTTTLSIHIKKSHFVTSDYGKQNQLIKSDLARPREVCSGVKIQGYYQLTTKNGRLHKGWVHVLWGQQEDSWQQQSEWHYQSVIKWKRVIQWYTSTNFISYGREVRSYSKWPKLQWCHFGVRISDLIFLHFRYWFEWFCLRRSVNISTCHSLGAHAWEFKVI